MGPGMILTIRRSRRRIWTNFGKNLIRNIRETLRLPVERSLQPGPQFDRAIGTCTERGILSKGNIIGTILMLERSADAVDCEFEGMKNEEWSTNGLWDLPRYQRPGPGVESDGWREAHGGINGRELLW